MALPTGRLTLTTAVPVLTATVTAASTIYYTPYNGGQIPLYNGSSYTATSFTELSQATSDSTKSPAAVANNSNYDLFVWSDGGTVRCTRGPLWTSDTGRGTGAGTTELERVLGLLLNKVDITNGPAANRGTYVGTVRSNGSATIDFIYAGVATTGSLGVWNMYNRVDIATIFMDSTDSFTMTNNGVRAWNNSNTNRINFISGLAEDVFVAQGRGIVSSAGNAGLGIGYDSTSAISGLMATYGVSLAGASFSHFVTTSLGWHFMQMLEVSQGAAGTGYGDAGVPTLMQSGMSLTGRM